MEATAPFINKARGNVKALPPTRPHEIEFTCDKVLLVGPNGAGKSRWQEIIDLALTKTADQVWLRRMTKEADLVVLIPSGDERLWAEVSFNIPNLPELSKGTEDTATYEFHREEGKAKKAKHHTPAWLTRTAGDWVLPVRKVHEAFTAGPEKARSFLLPFVARDDSQEISRRIPIIFQTPAQMGGKNPTTISGLLEAVALANLRHKEEMDVVKASNTLAETLKSKVQGPEPTDEVLRTSERTVEVYKRMWQKLIATEAQSESAETIAEAQRIRGEYEAAKAQRQARLQDYDNQIQQTKTQLALAEANLPPDPGDLPQNIVNWRMTLETGKAHGNVIIASRSSACFACGNQQVNPQAVTGVQAYIGQQEANIAAEVQRYENAKTARALHSQHLTDGRAYLSRLEGLRAEVERTPIIEPQVQTRIGQVDNLQEPDLTQLPPGSAIPKTAGEAKVLLDTFESVQRQGTSLRAEWKAIRAAENQGLEALQQANWWAAYAEGLTKVVGELLDAGVLRFQEVAQKYLPPEWKLHIQLRDGGREVFRFGLLANGNLDMAPSEGQLVAIMLAVAAACLECRPGGPPAFAFLASPTGCDWDPRHLAMTMKALARCPFQVLLTSTSPPTGKPKDWQIIEVGEKKEPKARAPKGKGESADGTSTPPADASGATGGGDPGAGTGKDEAEEEDDEGGEDTVGVDPNVPPALMGAQPISVDSPPSTAPVGMGTYMSSGGLATLGDLNNDEDEDEVVVRDEE